MFFTEESLLKIPCERFTVTYHLYGTAADARLKAEDICVEQTVEFPAELVPTGPIHDHILGRIECFEPTYEEGVYKAVISYPVDGATTELTQLLNMMFGNISIKPGIVLVDFNLPESLIRHFKGPRFGVSGLRELLGVPERPLLFTALKPMGLKNEELAQLAYTFAKGGIDIIKDDHGLADQPFCPFEERVRLVAAAIEKANMETGGKSIYMPNISGPCHLIHERAKLAKALGAGALMVSPGLVGWDTMRMLAEDDELALPIISHPALLGSYVLGNSGIAHGALFGKIARLAGADGSIYPNFGGRFSFSREACKDIAHKCSESFGGLKPIFPCPGGGMSLESIPTSLAVYGKNLMFLIGGGLFKAGPNLEENCKYFKGLVEGE